MRAIHHRHPPARRFRSAFVQLGTRSLIPVLALGLLTHFPLTADAAGFRFSQQSAKAQALAYAGAAAHAGDASTVWFNPAGMTRFDRPMLTTNVHAVYPEARFIDGGSTTPFAPSLAGRTLDDGADLVVAPQLFYVHPLTSRVAFGIGVNVPFGLGTEYAPDWVGRYHSVESELSTLNFNPSIAWQIRERLSVGFGLSLMYADARLINMVDAGAICAVAITPGNPTCGGLVSPSNPSSDTQAQVEGDDWAGGFNFGVLAEFSDRTRAGFHVRSRINHTLEGDASFDRAAVFAPGTPIGDALSSARQFVETGASAELSLPENYSLSVVHELNGRVVFLADASYTRWSTFDEIAILFDSAQADSRELFAWRDVWRYSAGMTLRQSPSLEWRFGAAFEETPVPSRERQSPRVPGDDRIWLTAGLGWTKGPFEVDGAFTYIHSSDTEIVNQNPQGHLLRGDFKTGVTMLSLGLSYKF